MLLLALLGQAHLADSRGVLAGVRTLSREGVRPVLTRSKSGCDENATAVAVPPRQAAARGRVGRPTGAQGLGWVDEAGHADERSCQLGVLSGGGVEAADVAPEQSLTRRGASRHTREGEVGAGGHLPRRLDDAGEFVVQPPRSKSSMAAEVAAEGDGALGGEGQAVAVRG